mmetsp:Transcript_1550/g.3441  ORF Transcript_1550/g.3441 Transcript_1550/m.3441 type:complete len:279 (+) Transcript_1550:220-1056(+)
MCLWPAGPGSLISGGASVSRTLRCSTGTLALNQCTSTRGASPCSTDALVTTTAGLDLSNKARVCDQRLICQRPPWSGHGYRGPHSRRTVPGLCPKNSQSFASKRTSSRSHASGWPLASSVVASAPALGTLVGPTVAPTAGCNSADVSTAERPSLPVFVEKRAWTKPAQLPPSAVSDSNLPGGGLEGKESASSPAEATPSRVPSGVPATPRCGARGRTLSSVLSTALIIRRAPVKSDDLSAAAAAMAVIPRAPGAAGAPQGSAEDVECPTQSDASKGMP